ncbi:MAG: PAS domain-containing protein, partial [Gemmatimonadales bacterium]
MTKSRRLSPGGVAAPRRARIDLLQAAADIVAALPDAVVVTAVDRRVLAANDAAAELLGWE